VPCKELEASLIDAGNHSIKDFSFYRFVDKTLELDHEDYISLVVYEAVFYLVYAMGISEI